MRLCGLCTGLRSPDCTRLVHSHKTETSPAISTIGSFQSVSDQTAARTDERMTESARQRGGPGIAIGSVQADRGEGRRGPAQASVDSGIGDCWDPATGLELIRCVSVLHHTQLHCCTVFLKNKYWSVQELRSTSILFRYIWDS